MTRRATGRELVRAAEGLSRAVSRLSFSSPVAHVYNPLEYAWEPHRSYLERFGAGRRRVVFLGMNPGPFGMMQTGIPFGEVSAVRDWMGIEEPVRRPSAEHPTRPIEGFATRRSEVSGRRLWGLFAQRFGSAEAFFREHLVINYCPLVFLEISGRNRTPDKLDAQERAALEAACDRHLAEVLDALSPEWAIGVGAFAEGRLRAVLGEATPRPGSPRVLRILHPSPASPAANRDWSGVVVRTLTEAGVWQG